MAVFRTDFFAVLPFFVVATFWVLVKGLNFSYYDKETRLFTIDPFCGNLN